MDQRRRRRRRGRRQTRRRRKRNLLLKMIILIILIVGTIAALLLWKKYGPSKETADLNKYYGVENDNQLAIVVIRRTGEAFASPVTGGSASIFTAQVS